MATALMRETFFGIHGPAWTGLHGMEHPPYFVEAHYMGFREMEPTYSVYGEPHFSPYDSSSFPVGISGSPSFVHVGEPMYYETLGHLGSLRPPYSIPMHGYPKEASYEDVPQHGPTRSSSSVPSYSAVRSEAREPRPKQQKVAPEIELKVPMCCSKCEGKMREILRKLEGVTDVVADRHSSKVTVIGKVDPEVVLKKAQKQKKKADFWTKDIYSKAFIDFIQSKTGRAEPEEEITSSYHQHLSMDECESHHAYEESESLSSFEEYPGFYPERDAHAPYDGDAQYGDNEFSDRNRGYYHAYSYGKRNDQPTYGRPSHEYMQESYASRDDRSPYEGYGVEHYDRFEPAYGAEDRLPYYERESRSAYEDYRSPYYSESSSYRPSQSYGPSEGYIPSEISNPGYMKRVIY